MYTAAQQPPAQPLKSLLASYTSTHPLRSPSPLPPSSRQDPKLQQRLPPQHSNPFFWSLATWVSFAWFAANKGLSILWSLLEHFLWGPRRRSWGYRMTFIVSFMRNVAHHTSLADIVLIRRLVSLHAVLPLPVDAVVTPISFTVPRHATPDLARGFLADLDGKETGQRVLTGEWVVGTEVWRNLKAKRRAQAEAERRKRRTSSASAPADSPQTEHSGRRTGYVGRKQASMLGLPSVADMESDGRASALTEEDGSTSAPTGLGAPEKIVYYIHGGAYYVGNAATHRVVTIEVSKACDARVFAITYRLAPEHAFPLPLHDVLIGYLRLLAPPLSLDPSNIIIAGDSAGGGLSLALCMYLRDEGYQMPAGLVLMSPWVDLTMSCGSWDENAEYDVVPRPDPDDHLNPVGCYLGPQGIATYLTHPYASPLFGDLSHLPPMLIQSGDSEVLRDEITLLAHKATMAGVPVTHELYEDMVHVFQMFTWLPAAKAAVGSVGRWVRETLPQIQEERRLLGLGMGEEHPTTPARSPLFAMAQSRVDVGRPRQVTEDGADVGSWRGEVLPDEEHAVRDQRALELAQTSASGSSSGLGLDVGPGAASGPSLGLQPSLDPTPLPASRRSSGSSARSRSPARSGSGSPTPTASRARSPVHLSSDHLPADDLFSFSSQPSAPRLRRALTAFAGSASAGDPTSPSSAVSASASASASKAHSVRRRRRTATQGAASLHSPSASASLYSYSSASSNPVSPSPSMRRRLRSPSASSAGLSVLGVGGAAQTPTTRQRSDSHSDIHMLVEGYQEGGAANETTVYAPGGEVRSVGVLGEDEDDMELEAE